MPPEQGPGMMPESQPDLQPQLPKEDLDAGADATLLRKLAERHRSDAADNEQLTKDLESQGLESQANSASFEASYHRAQADTLEHQAENGPDPLEQADLADESVAQLPSDKQ